MAEYSVTKQVLAYSLKSLMRQRPLSKITVGDICEECSMNRKSFYYHFHDKYDLVNWIFSTEFYDQERGEPGEDMLLRLCRFFKKNTAFYRTALQQTGQNSFREYLAWVIRPVAENRLRAVSRGRTPDEFSLELVDTVYRDSIARWVEKGCEGDPVAFLSGLYTGCRALGQLTPAGNTCADTVTAEDLVAQPVMA